MATKRKQRETFTTPKGEAVWPKLNKPDRYNEASTPNFNVKLALEGDEAAELQDKLTEIHAQSIDKVQEERLSKGQKKLPKAKAKLAEPPFLPEYDDDDEETGRTIFKFKLNSEWKDKDGGVHKRKLPLIDSKKTPITDDVWNGSMIKVAYRPRYAYSELWGCGVTLDMVAVQVLELVGRDGAAQAGAFFDEEEGYEAPEKDEDAFDEDEDTDTDSDGEGGEDF